jgi:[protein-PII] uridylyltransferase
LRGSAFGRSYASFVDQWLRELVPDEAGSALLAVGSYGRRELCPGSDLDLLLLLHDGRRAAGEIAHHADRLWYPLWDAGLQVDHSVRTIRETVESANSDLRVMLGLLDGRVVLGDEELGRSLLERVRAAWRQHARRRLPALDRATSARHDAAGEVAFLLEPDLKEGHGGQRDLTTLAALAQATDVVDPEASASRARETLLEVRVALHRITGRRSNVLGLAQQDDVARALDDADADVLMRRVAGAARAVSWQLDDAWQRVRSWIAGPPRRSSVGADRDLGYGIVLRDQEVALADHALSAEPTTLARVAAAAAYVGAPIERSTRRALAADAPELRERWPDEARDAFISLLGAGPALVPVLEALDHHDLITRLLPEWEPVRSRPQRNAFHQFTVDRHLMEAAARAAALARRVERPDLLLVSAFLHDLGKGYPGDHTAAGVDLMRTIAARMAFRRADVDLLAKLVAHHLLLPKVATSRDLADPRTLESVAVAVGSPSTLELLYALTEADSLATGPTAWTPWRAGLVGELVDGVRALLAGVTPVLSAPTIEPPSGPAPPKPTVSVRDGTVRVVGPDRPGLFAATVGVLTLHGQDVRAARAASSPDVAVAEFDVEPAYGAPVAASEVEAELVAAVEHRLDVEGRLRERAEAYGRLRLPTAAQPAAPRLIVHDEESPTAVIVEVRAPDGVGVLYRIAGALRDAGLDIRLAKIATLGHEVVDTFYVVDARTSRRPSPTALAALEPRILAALNSG